MRMISTRATYFSVILGFAAASLIGCGPDGNRRAPLPSKRIEGQPTGSIETFKKQPTLPDVFARMPSVLMADLPEAAVFAGEVWTPLVVHVLTSAGEDLPEGADVRVEVVLTDGSESLLGETSVALSNSVAVFSDLSYERAEDIAIEFRASGDFEGIVTGLPVVVRPAPAARLELSLPYKSVTAGEAMSFTVTAFDAFDNIDTAYAGQIILHTTAPQATVPSPLDFGPADAGVAVFEDAIVLRKVGTPMITAAAPAETEIVPGHRSVHVIPAAADHLELGEVPGLVVAGHDVNVPVVVRDAFGNTATGYGGDVTVTGTDPQATASAETIESGKTIVSTTLRTAGEQELTVAAFGVTSAQGQIEVAAGPVATLEFVTTPGTAWVGVALNPAPRVSLKDAFGNVVDQPTPVSVGVVGNATPVVGSAIVTSDSGVATFDTLALGAQASWVRLIAAVEGLEPTVSSPFDVFHTMEESLDNLSFDQAPSDTPVFHGVGTSAKLRVSGFSGQIGEPGTLCTDWHGNVFVGQQPGGASDRPIVRIAPDDTITIGPVETRPAALASFQGELHVAGGSTIRGPVSFDGALSAVWAEFDEGDLRDMVLDDDTGLAYVVDASGAGELVEINGISLETRVLMTIGDDAALAVHPVSRDLWAVTRNGGHVYHIDTATGDGETVVLADVWDTVRVEHIEFHTVGSRTLLYATVQTESDAGIYRWSAAGPGSLQPWVSGMNTAPPIGLACGGHSGNDALYVTTHKEGVLALQCLPRAPGVSDQISVVETGRQVAITAHVTTPGGAGAIAVDPTTGTIAVAPVESTGSAPVGLIDEGVMTATPGVDDPDAVAFDSTGAMYVAGRGAIFRASSAAGAQTVLSPWTTVASDIGDLVVDTGHQDVVWASLSGAIVRIGQDVKAESIVFGAPGDAPAAIAVAKDGNLWALALGGDLWRISSLTLEPTWITNLGVLHPEYLSHQRMVFGPVDGQLYIGTRFAEPARSVIARYDTVQDTVVEFVQTGPEAVVGLAFAPVTQCLLFSAPSGRIHEICVCD
ncbi:MAG: hypothetical protein ACI9WU_004382 [Myxococcota bacterium]|jgi:hypothetical protein